MEKYQFATVWCPIVSVCMRLAVHFIVLVLPGMRHGRQASRRKIRGDNPQTCKCSGVHGTTAHAEGPVMRHVFIESGALRSLNRCAVPSVSQHAVSIDWETSGANTNFDMAMMS